MVPTISATMNNSRCSLLAYETHGALVSTNKIKQLVQNKREML